MAVTQDVAPDAFVRGRSAGVLTSSLNLRSQSEMPMFVIALQTPTQAKNRLEGGTHELSIAELVYSESGGLLSYSGLPWGEFLMKRMLSSLLAAGLLAGAFATTTPASAQTKKESASMPKVGDMAPDFSLKYFTGSDLKDVKLSDYRGKKNVVLAFYIFAFTGG